MFVLTWLIACGSCGGQGVAPTADDGASLGSWPLCEPSAALPLADGAVLLADNEGRRADPSDGEVERPTLWLLDGDRVNPVRRDEAAQDVESLVAVGRELWVVGSMSRNKDCEVKPKRWEIHRYDPGVADRESARTGLGRARVIEHGKGSIAAIEGSEEGCMLRLFPAQPAGRPLCAAIVAAARSRSRSCTTLNVEGAVEVDGRVWLGLRAPVVDGRAAMVRVEAGHERLAFDAVRWLDLGGEGVRELTRVGDDVYGIAGSEVDPGPAERSSVFRFPASALRGEEDPTPRTVLRDLPPGAEGMWIVGATAHLVLDGEVGDGVCRRPAGITERPLVAGP